MRQLRSLCDARQALFGQWRQKDPNSPAHDPSHAVDLAVERGDA
ncbi:MAG TPA: hypothetical protein VE198_16175 [Actinoallomurus sp.]|nr:hypothetical protein [Actinoallomurus sp.]